MPATPLKGAGFANITTIGKDKYLLTKLPAFTKELGLEFLQ